MIQFDLHDDIKFQTIQYPDGAIQIRLTSLEGWQNATAIQINWQYRSDADIMKLALLKNALGGVFKGYPINLNVPYLPYARADRRFTEGDCAGLETLGNLINAMEFSLVHTLDVHSDKAFRHIKRLINWQPTEYIQRAVGYLPDGNWAVMYPDAGAAYRYPSAFFGATLVASKKRDTLTGKLLGFEVPDCKDLKNILIIDDICDAGGTFNGIADKIPEEINLYLYVTHGIFSKGIDNLSKRFKKIYTTDSLSQKENERLVVLL